MAIKGDLRDEVVAALQATPNQLLDRLANLPGAIRGDETGPGKDDGWAYFPGTNDADCRVLLVAHVDTVANTLPTRDEIWQRGGMLTRQGKGKYGYNRQPLGADDRAGVAATWCLRESGHSILWTDGEETGGWGVQAAIACISHLLEQHIYMIQIDRAGDEVLALYPGATSDEFEDFLHQNLPVFDQYWGTFTDIATLGPALGLCGANLAAGYLYEHTAQEVLFLDSLEGTTRNLDRLLRGQGPARRFRPDPYSDKLGPASEPWWETGVWEEGEDEESDEEYFARVTGDTREPFGKVYTR